MCAPPYLVLQVDIKLYKQFDDLSLILCVTEHFEFYWQLMVELIWIKKILTGDGGLGLLPADVNHYLIPDCQVAREFLEVLENPVVTGIIFLQTVVHSVRLYIHVYMIKFIHAYIILPFCKESIYNLCLHGSCSSFIF